MKDLNFAVPTVHGRGGRNDADVSVCINKSGSRDDPDRQSLVFRFSMNAANKIAPNSEYASYAFDDELRRVYFIAREKTNGFKLSKRGKRRVMTSGVFDLDLYRLITGDYTLFLDPKRKLFYINVKTALESIGLFASLS
jgi:hypothetical protein